MENKLEFLLKKMEREKNQDPGSETNKKMFVICEIKSEDGG